MGAIVIFIANGLIWFGYGLAIEAGGDYQAPSRLLDWATIYVFSAGLFVLAVALPALGRLADRAWLARIGLVGGIASATAGVVNILEDGLSIDWMFLPFVVSTIVVAISLIFLGVGLVVFAGGRARLFAIVPIGVLATLAVHGIAGGLISLVVWLGAALILTQQRRTAGGIVN